ncbi:MAG TPA: GNAT family N-acetyltransferase [Alphaproteobacteria bacterium]|jgi:phosphinothricin acetyltransferase
MTDSAASSLSPRPAAGTLAVRPAAAADMAGIQAIYAHHVRTSLATFEIDPPDVAEMARRHADVAGRGLPYLVAEADGRLLGFGYAAPYRARAAYRHTVENSIYVADAARGQGVGRAVLAAVIEGCAALGYRQMVAVIGDSANAASIGLHTALGFKPAGLLPAVGFKFGRWVDSVLMQRPLGEGSAQPPDGNPGR